jgi:uncharacterized protein
MEPFFLIILFAGGILEGLYASNVGCGALVSIPLLLLTGLPVHHAIATNRFSAIFLESSSALKYHTGKKLKLKYALPLGLLASIGSLIGSNLVTGVDETFLNHATAVLLAVIFVIILFKDRIGLAERPEPKIPWLLSGTAIFLLGIYGGFFGAGFGTMATFVLLMAGFSFITGAANSRIIGLMMSVPATVVFILNGLVNYPYGISLGIGTAIGGWIGAGIGIKKGNIFIKTLFIIVLIASIIKLVLGL